ncbi:MAG: dihydrofolate reductase family protein [Cytophagales bacterium]|nr:dihydrofolate reductase family protein [Cytophagales bacterium]
MKSTNSVFIATSMDGYIADKNGQIDWLHDLPNPENDDMGYHAFTEQIDALVMGRTTFETVCSFDIEWPYTKPVYVLSRTLKKIPEEYTGKVFLVNGSLKDVLAKIYNEGHYRLYIDGGATIQSFLQEDLIDELIITIIPVLLGGGTALFSDLNSPLQFKCIGSKHYLESVVQNHFKRNR